jgi:hypothetical protein
VRRQLIIAVLTLGACGAVLGAILLAGWFSRTSLQSTGRYQIQFGQIDCLSPPGVERETFLGQVRYYGEMPETVSLLDDALRDRLIAAFSGHPWVEHVDKIEIGPGQRIAVALKFRTPVLAVEYFNPMPVVRAVDRRGILLPVAAATQSLPRLTGKNIQAPVGAGRAWGSPDVEGAASVAGLLQANQAILQLMQFQWEDGQLHLHRDSGESRAEVIWGRTSSSEAAGEPSAEAKLRRLLDEVNHLDDRAKAAKIDLRTP